MKKGIVIALLVVFSAFAAGIAFAVINPDGTMTIDKPAAVFPAKKLKEDGTKKKNPVTFNHKKHGEEQKCPTCHHQQKELTAENVATIQVKSCWVADCHGPAAVDKKIDSFAIIHDKKAGRCIACHVTDAKAQAEKAPKACKDCHGGTEE